MDVFKLVDKIASGYIPSIKEVKLLLEAKDSELSYIYDVANSITEKYCSNVVHVRGIIEFSNYCRCSCAYCGLNANNKLLKRYRMVPEEIVQVAKEAWDVGYKTVVLQSGEDPWYTREIISEIIKDIKAIGDIAITLSVGERSYEDYRQWKQDGADRFLLKHETMNKKIYDKLHLHSSLENRLKSLWQLKKLQYQVGSGFMIGLPGETLEDIARDILFLKKLDGAMAGIGPFIPHKGTVLGEAKAGSNSITLKVLALARIILKTVHLPATTALQTLGSDDAKKAFDVGANVIMLKLEPYKYRRLYEIYPKPIGEEKLMKQERMDVERFIQSMGKEVSKDRGDSLKCGERMGKYA